MGNTLNERLVWSLRGTAAELSCGKLCGRVDASRPDAGLHDVEFAGVRQAADLLRVYRSQVAATNSWPLPVAESYVRGNDLVAGYQSTDDWPFSPQLYWRANSLWAVDGVLASLSLLVSVQTHLLDTVPQIGVASRLPCDETLLVSVSDGAQPKATPVDSSHTIRPTNEDCCIVSRGKGLSLSYVEIMPAADFHAVRLQPERNGVAIEWRIFAEFLEKGVIRRARVHAAFLPRENDIEIAAACCKAMGGLELPLTT